MKLKKEILITLFLFLILLTGCAEKNQEKEPTEELSEEPAVELTKETIEEPEKTIEEKAFKEPIISPEGYKNKTFLYIEEEDWVYAIKINGFKDLEFPAEEPLSMFLYKNKEYPGPKYIYISIFGEIVPNVNDSKSCRTFYTLGVDESIKPTSIWERDGKALSTYTKLLQYQGKKITNRHVNAFVYYDKYCLDFHLSMLPFEENDLQKFYDVIDSIQLIEDIPESGDYYIIPSLEI